MTGLRRPDGPAKLRGAAGYAADIREAGAVTAALVPAMVPVGRLASLDSTAARAAEGVLAVLDHTSMPALPPAASPPWGHSVIPMQGTVIAYEGQPIAMVLAQTWEQAKHAADLVTASYAEVAAPLIFGQAPVITPTVTIYGPGHQTKGDVEAGLAGADVTVTETYRTADRHHNPIEPSATLAWWEGDKLVLHSSVQSSPIAQFAMAMLLQIPPEQIRLIGPYVGGGFGCKGYAWPHLVLPALAAKVIGRPVRLVMTRAQMYTMSGHMPATRQTISLGAMADGRLTALRHHSVNPTSRADEYVEYAIAGSRWLYDSPAIDVKVGIEHVDRPTPTPMRAPHAGAGMFALESAMDELAYRLGMDPVELRLRNEPAVDPLTGRPFSSRPLVECLREGARRFGWYGRSPSPRLMRDGNDLIGWGMAVATMETLRGSCAVRMWVGADGRVVVKVAMQETGTGLPAMVQAAAAEALGCPPNVVEVRHGDTVFPAHEGAIGSTSTISLGSAVQVAAHEVLTKLNGRPGDSLAELLARAGLNELEVEGRWAPEADSEPGGRSTRYSMHTYGAVFAEVRVDAELGLVRMSRFVGVYGAGRIINPLAARSQLTGGVVWGYGQALLEQSTFEPTIGRFLSKNLAGFTIPVNADIGELDVSFVADEDRAASPIGSKGIGELSAVSTCAAIANAVYHATGRRIRELPIRPHHLI